MEIGFLRGRGFIRKFCERCGAPFWTLDPNRRVCGDAECVPYGFVGSPPTAREYSLEGMREAFLSFLEREGHERVSRYPVVARWRDDVLLVNASIYDFQPHVTSGLAPPPANPLAISQPCIRLVDTDLVGVTGRHLTGFEMMAHHAFNYPDKEIYWKDRTVELAHEFLTSELGVDEGKITYKEKPWIGGGNGGEALEVLVDGLEVATLVFMDLVEDPNGDVELGGKRFSRMEIRVVDTGYGLERLKWLSDGAPTIYHSIYGDQLGPLLESVDLGEREEGILSAISRIAGMLELEVGRPRDPEEARRLLASQGVDAPLSEVLRLVERVKPAFVVVDHARSLALMLNDGAVPSNTGVGYLARMLIRRLIRSLDALGNPQEPWEAVLAMYDRFSYLMDPSMRPIIREIMELEEERFRRTLKRGRAIVKRYLRRGRLGPEELVLLYDSHGLTPDFVKQVASEEGVEVEVPPDFHRLLANRHSKVHVVRERKEEGVPEGLPPTRKLYYEDQYMREFEAEVLWSGDGKVVLDRTAFYPEGGGQPGDVGWLHWDGGRVRVTYTVKSGEVVVHRVDGEVPVGARVRGVIDWERRRRLMVHHTSTHILLASLREVLGPHVWQAGAQKGIEYSRLDITHYKGISEEEITKIEDRAMEIVEASIPVRAFWMERTEAERKYGFRLYQGGIPPGREIRVVEIEGVDAQACGGTHLRNTSEAGPIKIIKTDRSQDGVVRITFAAGRALLDAFRSRERILREASSRLKASPEELPSKVSRLLEMWKAERRRAEALREALEEAELEGILSRELELGPWRLKFGGTKGDPISVAKRIASMGHPAMVYGEKGGRRILAIATPGDPPASEIAREIISRLDLSGGGSGKLAVVSLDNVDPRELPRILGGAR